MPYSSNACDDNIRREILSIKPQTILDIGCGAGKYADMIKSLDLSCSIEGIEPDATYISRFKLTQKYDSIFSGKIQDFIHRENINNYQVDLVIMGDILEHLWKSDGIDILNFLMYRCKKIIAVVPIKYIQNGYINEDGDHPLESHISVWNRSDFENLGGICFEDKGLIVAVLDGFLS